MLGREIIQPINLDTADLNNPKKELPEYLSDLRSNISECHEIARENICTSQK